MLCYVGSSLDCLVLLYLLNTLLACAQLQFNANFLFCKMIASIVHYGYQAIDHLIGDEVCLLEQYHSLLSPRATVTKHHNCALICSYF